MDPPLSLALGLGLGWDGAEVVAGVEFWVGFGLVFIVCACVRACGWVWLGVYVFVFSLWVLMGVHRAGNDQ